MAKSGDAKSMKLKFEYIGIMIGADGRTSRKFQVATPLRRTKNFYVTQHGTKFKVSNFDKYHHGVGDWPLYSIINVERSRPWHTWRYMWE